MTAQILFTGHAPVHYLCFRPIYERLAARHDVDIFFSGGLRTGSEDGFTYDALSLYLPLGVPRQRILTVDQVQSRHFEMLFSANKRIVAPRENFGKLVQIFHGVSFRNRGVREENLAYDYWFLTGPYMRRKFIELGLLTENDERGLQIGFPKTDPLLTGTFDRAALLAKYGFDGTRPVLLYAPTGEAYNSLEVMGEEVIRLLADTDRYDILIKPHDHPKNAHLDWQAMLRPLVDTHTRLVRDHDIVPLLRSSDLLLTDASSVANEYALLDRPIVFLDVPELLRQARARGGALDLASWGRKGGVVVERPDDVTDAVAQSLADPTHFSGIRRAIAQDLFYNPGHATDTAVGWITREVRARERVAS